MPINPNIIMGLQQPQVPMADPNAGMNALAKIMQIKSAQQESDVNALKMQQMQRGIEDQNYLRGELAKPDADPYKIMLSRGMLSEANAFQKNKIDQDKTAAEAESKRFDMAHKRVESWGQVMGFVRQNPTPENAAASVQHLVTLGIMPPQMAQQALAEVQANPTPENISRWATMGFQAALQAKEQLPTFQTRNTGGTTDTLAIDPVSRKVQVANSVQNTQSPDAILQAQTSTENNKRSVGAQMANAAAVRDTAQATRDAALIGANLKNEELRGKLDDRNRQKQGAEASIAAQIGVIDKALTHPGRTTATGLSGAVDPRNYVPGTDAADFRAVLDQVGGSAFLQAFESLKGGGQITEVEGKKATDAIARLSRKQSDKEFEQSLRDLRDVMSAGYQRLAGKNYPNAAPGGAAQQPTQAAARISSDAEYNALPSGAVFIGPDGKQRRKP